MEILLISVALGLLTGAILALTGAGGTIIAVPLLIFGLHLTVAEAAPVALFAVCLSATTGALYAHRFGKVRYRAAGFIAATGVLTAPLGIWLAQKLPDAPLAILFVLILSYVSIEMWRQSQRIIGSANETEETQDCFSVPCQLEYADGRLIWTWPCARALAGSGMTTGFLSGLLGVGGGFLVVPALKKATRLTMQSILATSLAVIALISATGVTSAVLIDSMNWQIAVPFAAGALLGMLAGPLSVHRLTSSKLQQGFAITALCVALGMIARMLS